MAGRRPLTDEQKAARDAALAGLERAREQDRRRKAANARRNHKAITRQPQTTTITEE